MNKYNFDKIELHLHLDGAFRFSTIWELALKENVKMPKDTLEEYIEYIRYSANCGSVNQYLTEACVSVERCSIIFTDFSNEASKTKRAGFF